MVSLRLEFLQRIGSKDLSELMDHVARNHNDMDIARYTAMAHLVRSSDGDWGNARLDKEQKAIAVTTMRSGKTTLTFRINGKEFTMSRCLSATAVMDSAEIPRCLCPAGQPALTDMPTAPNW